jgi:uncharacterized protein (TIGR02611 family)
MFEKSKENWQRFKESEPGHRYTDRYHQRQQSRSGRFSLTAVALLVVGTLILLLGGIVSVTVPVPGVGWLLILLGLGMFAGESKHIARLLDWVEVRLRRAARWALASRKH